ncbi:MAG: hypothetical protein QOE70_2175 [Chthoniobacter sp.]|jgi:autotransporter-associated beta strand protein|nr:hypothetical protein [Chthoniobacter sp.]
MKRIRSSQPRPLACSLARFKSTIAVCAALVAGAASAATNIWTNTNATNSWNDPLNWQSGATPAPTDALFFTNTAPGPATILANGLDGTFSVQTLSFDTANSFSINANTTGATTRVLTLTGGTNALGGTDLLALSATTGTISMGVTAGLGTLNLALGASGNISIGNAAGAVVLGTNSVVSGAFSLSKSGPGTLTLAGANTFGGAGSTFTLTSGALNINSASALGNTANTFIINGGTIDNTSAGAITTGNYAQTWGGDFAFTGTQALNFGAGAVTLGASRVVTVGGTGATGTLTVNGDITGAGFDLTKAGTGTLVLNGVVGTTTGGVLVNAGTLTLTGPNTYTGATTLAGGATLNFNSTRAVGAGTLVLNGGTLDNSTVAAITNLNNNAQTWGGDFVFAGTRALDLGTGTVTLGASRIVTVNGTGANGTLTVGGNITGATFGLTKAGTGTLVLNGAVGTTTGGVTLTGGTLTLAGTNTYSGATTLATGTTLNFNNVKAIGTGTLIINGGTLDNTSGAPITNANTNAQTWAGNFSFGGTQALNLGTGAVAVSAAVNPTITANGTVSTATGLLTGNTLTEGGVIAFGANNLTVAGTGGLILTGANTGTGAVTINSGAKLQVGNQTVTGALPTGALSVAGTLIAAPATGAFLTLANTISGAGNITLNGNPASGPSGLDLTSASNAGFTGTYTLNQGRLRLTTQAQLGAPTAVITVNGSATNGGQLWVNANVTISNPITITGSGPLETTGLGAGLGAIRFNTGTYAGPITLAGAASINSQATTATITGPISGGASAPLIVGTFNANTGGILNINSANNTYSGGTNVNGQTVAVNAVGALGTGAVTLKNVTLSALTESVPNALTGTNSLSVQGGTATLSFGNNYTGATTVGGTGTLTATAAGAVPAVSTLTMTGGTVNNNAAGAIAANISVGGGTFAQTAALTGASQTFTVTAGTANLSQANTYGGVTTISGGAVNASVAGAIPGAVTMTGGTLTASNTTGSANGTGIITLNGGLLTSAVTGGTFGTVNGGSTLNTINPGGVGTVGQLTLGALSTGSGTVLQFDETTPWVGTPANTGDLLSVTGTNSLTLANGTSLTFSTGTPSAAGNYRLIGYNGTTPAIPASMIPASPRAGIVYTYDTTSDPNFIDLKVVNTSTAVTAGWIPTTAGTFSWADSANWTGGVPSLSGDIANFATALGANNEVVQLNGQQHVGTLTLSPTGGAGTYTIAQNATTDNLSLDNGSSAASVVNAANNNVISAPVFLLSSNSNFNIATGTTLALSGSIGGAGKLTVASGATSGGTLSLTGNNTFTGGIDINAGTLLIPGTTLNALGNNGVGQVTFTNNGILSFSAGTTQLNAPPGLVFNFGTGGGTINTAGAGTTGKLLANTANTFTGAGTFTKTGGAVLQVPVANTTFTGNVNLNGGFIEMNNAAALGSGTITVNSGGELVGGTAAGFITNPLVIAGTGIIGANANGAVFSGSLTVPATGSFMLAPRAFQTITTGTSFTIAGNISGPGNTVSTANLTLTSSQTTQGTVIFAGNNLKWTGSIPTLAANQSVQFNGLASRPGGGLGIPVTLNGGVFGLGVDGDGTGTPGVAGTFSDTFTLSASSTVTVGRSGLGIPIGSSLFTTASNKIIVESNPLSIGNMTLAVNNNNGYGLAFTGTTTLTAATPTFSVTNATFSNQTQGLILQGPVAGSFGFIKAGAGTLVLANSPAGNIGFTTPNSFTGNITVGQGVMSVDLDHELGTATNVVNLAPTTGTSTLRATGTFSTGRTVQLGGVAANIRAIEVTSGNKLTLTSPFNVTGLTNATFAKNDAGTLELAANNTGWSGVITVNQGALLLSSATGAGSGTILVGTGTLQSSAAVQVAGGLTVSNPLTFNASGQDQGINFGGGLQAVGGTVGTPVTATWSGLITQISGVAGVIGADAFTTLNLTGGITNGNTLYLTGAGNINISGGTMANSGPIIEQGSGTVTISVSDTTMVGSVTSNAGALTLSGLGKFGAGGTAIINPGGTINVDDSGTATASRLGGKAMTLAGNFNYTVNSAAASNETLTTLTLNSGGSTFNVNPGTGSQLGTITFTTLTQNAGSSINFTGASLSANDKIVFTTSPTLTPGTGGILPRAVVGGADFATYGANGIAAFSSYNTSNNLPTAAALDTVKLTASSNVGAGPQTINALAISGTGLTAGGTNNGSVLTLTSGGLLVTGGANTLSIPVVALGATEGIVHVNSLSSATMSGTFTGTAGLTKADGGSLLLSVPQAYTGTTTVNGGTLQLGSGATNTLLPNNALMVNAGGTLDLNGGVQYVGALTSAGAVSASNIAGGIITSSTAGGTLVTNTGAGSFAGTISGATLGFARSGASGAFNIIGPLTYGGPTLINGGGITFGSTLLGVTLIDNGAISSSAPITINYASLNLNNSTANNTASLIDSSTRLNPLAPLNLSGGGFNYYGRGGVFSTQSVGPVTLVQGTSIISASNQSNLSAAPDGATLTLASLTRNAANGATVEFAQNYTNNSNGNLGLIHDSLGRSENIIIPTINGVSTSTLGGGLTNNMIGGWALAVGGTSNNAYFNTGTAEFASYIPGLGIGALNTAGFAGYDGTTFPTASQPTQNIRLTAGGAVTSGGVVLNSLNLASNQTGAVALTFANTGDTLNLGSGGLLINNVIAAAGATSIGAPSPGNVGKLTAGGTNPTGTSDLYLYYYANGGAALTINSQITDNPNNGGKPVRFVPFGGNWGASNIILAGANTYTGGTIVNQETLTIAATGNLPAPSAGTGLTINNGTVTQLAGGAIAPQSVVINGGGVLTLAGDNTLTGLTINNSGGIVNPTVNAGGVLTLSGGTINSTSSNVGTTSTITGGTLDFNGTTATVNVDAITVNGQNVAPLQASLNIASAIRNSPSLTTSLNKTGTGVLQLSGANTFSGGVTFSQGAVSGSIVSGALSPFGTGAVNVNGGVLSLVHGTGANSSLFYGNNVNINSGLASATINVNNTGTATNNSNAFELGTLTMNPATTLNIVGGNNHTVRFKGLSSSLTSGVAPHFNPAAGTAIALGSGGFTNANRPVNDGAGGLYLGGNNAFTTGTVVSASNSGAAPTVNTVNTPFGTGQTVTLNNGVTFVMSPVTGMPQQGGPAPAGYNQGGLTARIYSFNTPNFLNSTLGSGQSPAAVLTGALPGDTGNFNHPLTVTAATPQINTIINYSGLLKVTSAGTYTFQTAEDDQSQLIIDGITVTAVNTTTAGGGKGLTLAATGTGSIALSAGFHSIVLKNENQAGGGGIQLLYSGPDTVAAQGANPLGVTGPIPNLQAIAASNLYWTTNAAAADNNFLSAAQVNNAFIVPAAAAVTLDGQGTEINSTVASLNLGAGSALTVANQLGTGFIGVRGTTTVGTGVVLNPTTAALNLIGGISDTGNGVSKAGGGTLILGSSGVGFTGPFAVGAGAVQIADPAALTTGVTTVNSGTATLASTSVTATSNIVTLTAGDTSGLTPGEAVTGTGIPAGSYITGITDGTHFTISQNITTTGTPSVAVAGSGFVDLSGTTGVAGNLILNGVPGAATRSSNSPAALYNSSALPASVTGTVSIGLTGQPVATSIGGYGDITVDSTIQDGAAGIAWTKVGSNTLTLSGANTFTGTLQITAGVVKAGSTSALGGAGATTVNAGTTLDLNGKDVGAEPITLNGTVGVTGLAIPNTLGMLINNSTTGAAAVSGTVTLAAASTIGGGKLTATGSATATPASGDITVSGPLVGAFVMTKVGGNTLYLTNGANTPTGFTVSLGTVRLQDAGKLASGTGQNTVNTGGTIVLDNTGTAVSERMGNRGLFTNGNFTILGNATTPVTETINTGTNNFNFANSASVITFDASAGAGIAVTVASTVTSMFSRTAGATALIHGTDFGLGTGVILTGTGTSTGGTQNNGQSVGQAGGFGNPNRLIMPWALVDSTLTGLGTSFATFGLTQGITALIPAETSSTLTANNNVALISSATEASNITMAVNSLTLGESTADPLKAGGLIIPAGSSIQLDSGGILAFSNNTGITGAGTLTATNTFSRELIVHTVGSTTSLEITTPIYSVGGGLTKADGGTLLLSAQENYLGNTVVNGGTLKLNGGNQTLFEPFSTAPIPGNTAAGISGQLLQVNLGGTFDLNGFNQSVINFNSAGTLPNTGGTVTNSAVGSPVTFRTGQQANQTFAGSITGNLNYVRDGNNTYTLNSPNTFTGSTAITGGLTDLVDLGTFQNTSGVSIRRSVLRWNDTGVQAVTNRLSTGTVTMDGGAFTFLGRSGTNGVATLGNVNLNSGASLFTATPANGTATINLGSGTGNVLTRAVGATVNFQGGGGVGDNGRVFFNPANTLPTLSNGMLGGWATAIGTDPASTGGVQVEFATYDAASGVRLLGSYTTGVFAPNNNVRIAASTAVQTGGVTVNSLAMINGAIALTFANATDTLTLQSGGILTGLDSNAKSIGTTAVPGQLTTSAGQQELFIHSGANTLTVNSKIINNGAPVNVVLDSMSQTANTPTITLTGQNTYTGTTYVNGVIVNLNSANGPAIPGDLVLAGGNNNGADSLTLPSGTTSVLAPNQIADGATVTLNGGAQLSLVNVNETIAALKFTSDGGSNAANGPVVQTGSGILTVASGGITATNLTNAFNIATVNGFLNLPGAQVITVDNSSVVPGQIGLELNAAITNSGGLTKMGLGVLGIGGKSGNFTGPLLVNEGTVAFGASTANISQSAVTLAAGTTLDLRGLNGTIGALNGAGTVTNFNQTTGGTLTTGLKGGPASFTGTFTNPFVRGLLSVTKAGAGTLNLGGDSGGSLTSTSPNLGTLTVNQGAVTLDSATGKVGFTTYTLNSTGTINIDDSTNNVANRLGGPFQLPSATVTTNTTPRVLNLVGGAINITGPSTGDLAEGFGTVAVSNGGSTLTIIPAAAGTSTITLNTLGVIANPTPAALGGTLLLRGAGLGGIAGPGVTNVIVNTAPPVIGGGGAVGTKTISIRPDIIGDVSPTGSGTGFVTYVAGTGFRLLDTATELQAGPGTYGKLLPAVTTTGSTTVSVPSTSGLVIGQAVTGTGIPAGATIAALDVPNNTITLSAAATATGRVVATLGVVATSNVTSMTASTFNASTTLNSLVLNSGGITSTGAGQLGQNYSAVGALNPLILTSGGILAQAGSNFISGGQLTTNTTNQLIIHTVGDLAVNSYITAATGAQGVTKSGGGTLSLNGPQYYTGTTTVNGGTLALNSGQANTIMVTPTNSTPTLVSLALNAGTVDLKGQNQAIAILSNNNPIAGTGGTITSTAPAGLITSTATASTFSGSINGAIAFTKAGASTLTLTGANGYTGPTTVMGGILLVRDSGTLLGTSGITLNYGTLQLDDTGLINITPRIPVVPISMSGGGLTFNGDQSIDSATVGTVTAVRGTSTITLSQLTSNLTGRFGLTINNLVRGPNAIVNFTSAGTNANLGDVGGSPAIFLTQLDGVPFSSTNLVNGIIGGWAVVAGSEFASYVNAQGISRLSGTGYPGYGSTDVTAATATQNVNDGTTRTIAASKTVNSLRMAPGAAQTITLGSAGVGATLTIASGGLLTNANFAIGFAQGDTTGLASAITSGTSELDVFVNQSTTTISTKIVNGVGPAATLSLVKSGPAALTLSPGASNTYSGMTIVNQGTLNLGAGVGVTVIPGDITINNATVTHTTANAGQIATNGNVTIIGAGTLTMPNAQNFLNSLSFNGIGGSATPTVATGTSSLTLGAQNAINSRNDNLATTPTISGGAIAFGYEFGPSVVNTSGTSPVDLRISAPITSVLGGPLVKTGPGSIALDGNNLYTTGFQLTDGTLIADNNAAAGTIAGTLTIGDPTTAPTVPLTILSGTAIRTLANPVIVNRDFTFGGTVATNGVILSAAIDFLGVNRTVTVSSPLVTSTLSGALTATAGLTKAGPGILTVSNAANNFGTTPTVAVNGGILKIGAAGAIGVGTDLTVAAGAEFDDAGVAQVLRSLSGAGLVTNSGAAATLTIGGLTTTDVTTTVDSAFSGVITNGTNALGIQKVGLGTLTFQNSGHLYTGTTTLKSGTLTGLVANAFSPFSSITIGNNTFGAASTQGVLNLNDLDQTIGGLVLAADKATPTVINIPAGKTLTIGGNLTVGLDVNATAGATAANTATTRLTFSGAGSLVVGNPTAIVAVGVSQGLQLNTSTTNTLDLTSLSSVILGSAAVPISDLRVGFGQTDAGTLLLSNTANLVTATNVSVGHSNGANGGPGFLTLGTGTNVLNADTFNIGFSKINGNVAFASQTAGSPGTVTINNKAGTGAATINVGSQFGTSTAGVLLGTLDLRGHDSTVNAGVVTVGNTNNSGGTGSASGVIFFDTGTFTAASLNLGQKSGTSTAATGSGTATLNLGGGNFAVSGATILAANSFAAAAAGNTTGTLNVTAGSFSTGTINAGVKSGTGTGAAAANINVSGGSLTVNPGGAFTLAANTGSGTATALLNITGGTVTSNVDITKVGGTGTTATVTLNGTGTLDLTGHSLGSAAQVINTLNLQSGTLKNVLQINGGAGITKTTAGVLTLDGANNFTGPAVVSAGTLRVAATGTFMGAHTLSVSSGAIAQINGTVSGGTSFAVASGGTLQGTGTISDPTTIASTALLAPGLSAGTLTFADTSLTLASGAKYQYEAGPSNPSSDLIKLTGITSTLTLSGAWTLQLADLGAGDPNGRQFILFDGDPAATLQLNSGSVGTPTIDFGTTGWTGGTVSYVPGANDIVLTGVVPEPSSWSMLAGSLSLALGLQRFRRRRA